MRVEQIEQIVLSAMIEGKVLQFDLTSPEQKECFELLRSIRILEPVPHEPTDPKAQGSTLQSARLGVRADSQETVYVRVASDWREKWQRWKDENTGTYATQKPDH